MLTLLQRLSTNRTFAASFNESHFCSIFQRIAHTHTHNRWMLPKGPLERPQGAITTTKCKAVSYAGRAGPQKERPLWVTLLQRLKPWPSWSGGRRKFILLRMLLSFRQMPPLNLSAKMTPLKSSRHLRRFRAIAPKRRMGCHWMTNKFLVVARLRFEKDNSWFMWIKKICNRSIHELCLCGIKNAVAW